VRLGNIQQYTYSGEYTSTTYSGGRLRIAALHSTSAPCWPGPSLVLLQPEHGGGPLPDDPEEMGQLSLQVDGLEAALTGGHIEDEGGVPGGFPRQAGSAGHSCPATPPRAAPWRRTRTRLAAPARAAWGGGARGGLNTRRRGIAERGDSHPRYDLVLRRQARGVYGCLGLDLAGMCLHLTDGGRQADQAGDPC
jgi:hypothetical protein